MSNRIRVALRCLSPLAHGGFDRTGNAVLFRRLSVVGATGMPRIPAVSGNALRGVLRRLVMREVFAVAGIDRTNEPKWDRLYGALANGGTLDGSEKAVKPEEVRSLREALPPLSLFGAALYSRMLAGHASFGICWPRCAETHEARLVTEGGPMAEDLIEEMGHARHVDEQNDSEASGVGPMPTTHEVLKTGTVLESEIVFARHAAPAEIGAVLHGLSSLDTLGAKAAAGLGRVEVLNGPNLGEPLVAYRTWLRDTSGGRDALRALAQTL